MNVDLIKGILSVVAAVIPLIILIVTLFNSRIEKSKQPIDSPSLKIIKIQRYSISEREWEGLKRWGNIIYYIYSIIFMAIYILIYIIILSTNNNSLLINFFIIFILFAILLLILFYNNNYVFRFKNSYDARYFIFQSVDILIEADYHYLFNKCHETLKYMKLQIVEINEDLGVLEASSVRFLFFPVLTKVYVQRMPPQASSEQGSSLLSQLRRILKSNLLLLAGKEENRKSVYLVKIEIVEPVATLLPYISKVTNRFINLLISRPNEKNKS